MPGHVLAPEVEIIADGGRRRRWAAGERLRIVEGEADAEPGRARQHLGGGTPQWRCPEPCLSMAPPDAGGRRRGRVGRRRRHQARLAERVVRQMETRIRELERQLGRKTMEVAILKGEAEPNGEKARPKEPMWLASSQPRDGSR